MEQQRIQQCVLNMKSHIIAISKEDKLAKPIILISGFLLSLWTSCIFIIGCAPYGLRSYETWIAAVAIITHLIISLAVTKGIHYGVKHNDPIFLKPWLILKVVEGILLFTGSVLCASRYYRDWIWLSPVGIILLMIGVYITLCVYTTYKQMISSIAPSVPESLTPEKPPAYDNFSNKKEVEVA